MLSKQIFDFLDTEIKINHSDRTKAARKIGISKEMIHAVMNRLEKDGGISTKTLEKICNGLECEIIIRKKRTK